MSPDELRQWTFALAGRTVAFVRALPKGVVEWRVGTQLVDSGCSVPAQYRAACRAQSTRDFIAKMKKLEEEADESSLWLALLRATGLPASLMAECESLEREFSRITAIAVSSVKTARLRLQREKEARRNGKRCQIP
jgi:four helix bundle protein